MIDLIRLAPLAVIASVAAGDGPEFSITDLGVVPGDFVSLGHGISPGGLAFGKSDGSNGHAVTWTPEAGLVALPNHPEKPFCHANGANDNGLIVGTGVDTLWGAEPRPLIWDGAGVEQLPVIGGLDFGWAQDVNTSGVVVGWNGAGGGEVATYWSDGAVHQITATTQGGAWMIRAFGVNDDGIVVGEGEDPVMPLRMVAVKYDIASDSLTEIPPLPGDDGAIAFDVSENGLVVGNSNLAAADSLPFIWSADTGTVEIPLPEGTELGAARGVNSDGWVVGTAGGQYAVPFLYDGEQTYRIQDLIPDGTGWDLSTNTVATAMDISEDGCIVGTGMLNGEIRAYVLTPATISGDLNGDGVVAVDDLLVLLAAWGQCDGCAEDLNEDGTVDVDDLLILLANWS